MRGGGRKTIDILRDEAGDMFRDAPDTSYLVFMSPVAGDATNKNKNYLLYSLTTTSREVVFFQCILLLYVWHE